MYLPLEGELPVQNMRLLQETVCIFCLAGSVPYQLFVHDPESGMAQYPESPGLHYHSRASQQCFQLEPYKCICGYGF